MKIRLAVPDDVMALHQILVQAAERIACMGSTQWSELLRSVPEEVILPRVLKNEVYVGVLDDEVVIMAFIMTEEEWDKRLWHQNGTLKNALYLHKLAIKRGFEGKGIAHIFLKELEIYLARLNKQTVLRLDCMAEKEALNNFYRAAGFQYVGFYQGTITHYRGFNLYEKIMKTCC